jgi:hypothetical protein
MAAKPLWAIHRPRLSNQGGKLPTVTFRLAGNWVSVASAVYDLQCGLCCFMENVLLNDDPDRLRPASAVACIWGANPVFTLHPLAQPVAPEFYNFVHMVANAHHVLAIGQNLQGRPFSDVWAAAGRPMVTNIPQRTPPAMLRFLHAREDRLYQATTGATSFERAAAAHRMAQDMLAVYQRVAFAFGGPNRLHGDLTQVNEVLQQSVALIRAWLPGPLFHRLRGTRMGAEASRLRQQLDDMGLVQGAFMTRDRVPDNLRHAVWGRECDPAHAAVLVPLGPGNLSLAVAARVLQQNLQPLLAMHELQGGYLVAGTPQHLAAGRMLDRMLRSVGMQPGAQGEAHGIAEELSNRRPATEHRRLKNSDWGSLHWEGLLTQLDTPFVPWVAAAITSRAMAAMARGTLGIDGDIIEGLGDAVHSWEQSVRQRDPAAVVMWSAIANEYMRCVIVHVDPGEQARAVLHNMAQQADGEPSDVTALELWYDRQVVDVAVSFRHSLDMMARGCAPEPNVAA